MLFAYHEVADGDRVGWRYFWEGRLSCKRSLLVEHGLHDPRLAYSVDVELGYRLAAGPGLTVVHRRSAVSHMARPFTYDEFLARMEAKGAAQRRFAELHPDPEVRAVLPRRHRASASWDAAAPTFDARPGPHRRARSRSSASTPSCSASCTSCTSARCAAPTAGRCSTAAAAMPPSDARCCRSSCRCGASRPSWPRWRRARSSASGRSPTSPTEVIVVDNGSPHRRAVRRRRSSSSTTATRASPRPGTPASPGRRRRRSSCSTPTSTSSRGGTSPSTPPPTTGGASPSRYTDHGDGLGPAGPTRPARPAGASP